MRYTYVASEIVRIEVASYSKLVYKLRVILQRHSLDLRKKFKVAITWHKLVSY